MSNIADLVAVALIDSGGWKCPAAVRLYSPDRENCAFDSLPPWIHLVNKKSLKAD